MPSGANIAVHFEVFVSCGEVKSCIRMLMGSMRCLELLPDLSPVCRRKGRC